jgi:hypothetical protein
MLRLSILLPLLLGGCNAFPWLEQSVRLPDGSTVVRIMIGSGGEYRTVVNNPYGSASASSLPIANHRRTNLYLTPDHRLVTIEAGGDSARFDISRGRAPRPEKPPVTDEPEGGSINWRYVGVVYRGKDGLNYYPPTAAEECIPLLGAGGSNYRHGHQVLNSCPKLR